jgi:hypothetical protein
VFEIVVLPGNVPSPVLQLISPATASQEPLVGVAFHVPLAARADWRETPAMAGPAQSERSRPRRICLGFMVLLMRELREGINLH